MMEDQKTEREATIHTLHTLPTVGDQKEHGPIVARGS